MEYADGIAYYHAMESFLNMCFLHMITDFVRGPNRKKVKALDSDDG